MAGDGYHYGGKYFDKRSVLNEIIEAIPTLKTVIIIQTNDDRLKPHNHTNEFDWSSTQLNPDNSLTFTKVPFGHPLCSCVLFSDSAIT